jgi:AcrR family transcriptional regulator
MGFRAHTAIAPGESVASGQRRRILASASRVFGQQGFDRTTVEDVISPAGISRRTFYDLFSGKDEMFREAHERALDLLDKHLLPVCAEEETWPSNVAAGIAATIDWAESDPDLARLLAGGVAMAGPRAAYCHDQLVARFAPRLETGRQLYEVKWSSAQEEMQIAGIASVMALRLGSEGESLSDLASQLIELTLAPYIGVDEAARIAGGY